MAAINQEKVNSRYSIIWIIFVSTRVLSIIFNTLRQDRPNRFIETFSRHGFQINIDPDLPLPVVKAAQVEGLFKELQKIVSSDLAESDYFGGSVGISGNTIVVGAWGDDDLGFSSGAAYVFEWDPVSKAWLESKKLLASNGGVDHRFGGNVAISGDVIVVGSYFGSGFVDPSGSVNVFHRDEGGPGNLGEVKILTPSSSSPNAQFGKDIAIDGDLIIVSAFVDIISPEKLGSAFIFKRDLGGKDNWGEVIKLIPPIPYTTYFGHSIGIDGNTVVIGAPQGVGNTDNSGSAWVFEKDQGGLDNWGSVRWIVGSATGNNDWFGSDVSIRGGIIAVGAGHNNRLFVYEQNAGGPDNWGEVKILEASSMGILFGYPIFILVENNKIFIQSPSGGGQLFVFEKELGGLNKWGLSEQITPSAQGTHSVEFGEGLAAEGDKLIVGDFAFKTNGISKGAAFYFEMRIMPTPGLTPTITRFTPTPEPGVTPSPTPTRQRP